MNELLKQQISEMIPRLKETGLGFLTITSVKLMADLSELRVFYSVLGSEEDKYKTQVALSRAKYQIRHKLSKLENLRRVPKLEFFYDDTPEKADRLQRLLMQINSERDEGKRKSKKS